MLQPETLLPGCAGSKHYREKHDSILAQMIDGHHQRILVWGAGDGYFESLLQEKGNQVAVIPLDSVMGECCRNRGLEVLSEDEASLISEKELFDSVLLRDVLHLVESPNKIISNVRAQLRSGGIVIIRVPNFYDARLLKNRFTNRIYGGPWTRERVGATLFSGNLLKNKLIRLGFGNIMLKYRIPDRFRNANRITKWMISRTLSPSIYLSAKKI
jgi:2-polyprenyl-3-methyl-5-hydroxy-6-metoxy-1,4-benzoquinol methylase